MRSENHRVAVEPVRVSRNGKRFFSEAHKRMIARTTMRRMVGETLQNETLKAALSIWRMPALRLSAHS